MVCNRIRLIFVGHISLILHIYHLRPRLIDFTGPDIVLLFMGFSSRIKIISISRLQLLLRQWIAAQGHLNHILGFVNHNLTDKGSLERFQDFQKRFIIYCFFNSYHMDMYSHCGIIMRSACLFGNCVYYSVSWQTLTRYRNGNYFLITQTTYMFKRRHEDLFWNIHV